MNASFLPTWVLTVAIAVLSTLVIRVWNRPVKSSIPNFLTINDLLIALGVGVIAYLVVPLFQSLNITLGFSSDVGGLVLASISILFTVLTYVTLSTAKDVREVGDATKTMFKETEYALTRFRTNLQLLSQIRNAERLAELDPQKEIEVGHLQTLYKLFGSESECVEAITLLQLPDKRDALKLISEGLKEHILALPDIYPGNSRIKTGVSELRRLL